jgi:hypothetical protein
LGLEAFEQWNSMIRCYERTSDSAALTAMGEVVAFGREPAGEPRRLLTARDVAEILQVREAMAYPADADRHRHGADGPPGTLVERPEFSFAPMKLASTAFPLGIH